MVGASTSTYMPRLHIRPISVFQIRSSFSPFGSFQRFERVENAISYLFSARTVIPTPPASTSRRAQGALWLVPAVASS